MKPLLFQKAIEESLKRWFPHKQITTLPSVSLDLAVARGAAYYGKVRQGLGVAIGGGTPRAYYLAVDVKDASGQMSRQALTLLPKGSEEGAAYEPEQVFALRANTPVIFHLLTSHVRLSDQKGDLIPIDEKEMQQLPPIQTILRFGRKGGQEENNPVIPVHLGIRLTAIGTLELWLKSLKTEHRWNLEFQVRSEKGQEPLLPAKLANQSDQTFESNDLKEAKETVMALFQGSDQSKLKPGGIMEALEQKIGMERQAWPSSVLRGLWQPLLETASRRKLSTEHEARWWNLAGFLLRPGFGFALDDFRLKELWKIILGEIKSTKGHDVLIQKWICYRRIAGGLNKGQQTQLASDLTAGLFNPKNGKIEVKGKGEIYTYSEKIRALASFERLELPLKIRLGEALVARICQGEALACDYWALGRIGARHLVYGSMGQIIPKEICQKWIEQLLKVPGLSLDNQLFLFGQLARKTDYREVNLPDPLIVQIMQKDERFEALLSQARSLSLKEQEQVLGDHLPAGLILEL